MFEIDAPKTPLNDLKPSTPSTDKTVLLIENHIIVQNLTMPFRCIVVAKHFQGSDNLDTGGARRDKHDGVSLML
jgi:hypothetical protein